MPARQAVISLPIEQIAKLERFEASEGLSQLFVFTADVICGEADVDFMPHLGEAALVTVSQDGESQRAFSGLIYEAEFLDEVDAGFRYRLTLRPWLYALSRNQDFVIFQNLSAEQIIQSVFDARGCSDVDFTNLTGSYAAREYCVQYRESDFAFVSRLMEEEGIYYYFDHSDGRHVMKLCDARASHPDSAYGSLPYLPGKQGLLQDRFWRWTEVVESGAEGKATFRSFDFTKPTTALEATTSFSAAASSDSDDPDTADIRLDDTDPAPTGSAGPSETSEIYDFPADFLDDGRGGALTQAKIQSVHQNLRRYRGEGDPVWLAVGTLLTLEDHPIDRLNQIYLITGMTYAVEAETYVSGGGGTAADGEVVHLTVTATPADTPWRAPQTTPRPVARGPETAIVTGPDGETIYTDQYGRVKVRFHWDRSQPSSDPTCWMRVAGGSADGGFGHVVLPRIGQEVVVDFLNGNPDQPLIVGSVFNGAKTQPYPMPDDKTRSVWRSHTIQGGADDYNEISMEDKTGEEELKVQAQKDRNTLVKNDDTTTVNHDRTVIVQNDLKTTVQQGSETRAVQQGKRTTTIQGDDALTVNEGDHKTTVSMGDLTITVSMGDMTTDVALGDYSLKTDVGSVTVEAMEQIVLKVGDNSITIDQTGVTISALMISAQAQVEFSAEAAITEISGDAMTTVKGGIVMIN